MATQVKVTPGRLDIVVVQGDDMLVPLDWDIDITDFTFESKITLLDGSKKDITINTIDLSAGQHSLAITDEVSATIPYGKHDWYLRRTDD
ncbi:MAG: hypothetical protein JRC86_10850 [Deltaproteobacteria bacterium]|nr:hypothetical protein [Deltaproteobacteria bacterium]